MAVVNKICLKKYVYLYINVLIRLMLRKSNKKWNTYVLLFVLNLEYFTFLQSNNVDWYS